MWKYVLSIVIFCIVLFIYLHVNYHLKTSNDLEIYELDNGTKDKLEEVCELRQPFIFDFYNKAIHQNINKTTILGKYNTFDLNVRNTKDPDYNNEIYLPLQSKTAFKLFDDDNTSSYVSEKNQEFIKETGLLKLFQSNDESIRPGLTNLCNYDFSTGSKNSTTPFRYEINHRNYFYVASGSVEIKLAPPMAARYLHGTEDYDNFEFRSPINAWLLQDEYADDVNKINFMDVLLQEGKMIHIPPYWWYSFRYKEDAGIASFKYRTYMSTLSILPHLGMHLLQSQNVKHKIAKKYEAVIKEPVATGSSNIDDLKPLPDSNELPILNPATNPVEEIEIPLTVDALETN